MHSFVCHTNTELLNRKKVLFTVIVSLFKIFLNVSLRKNVISLLNQSFTWLDLTTEEVYDCSKKLQIW